MTSVELDEIMATLEHLWPASPFRDPEELETWREHLGPLNGDSVAQVLGVFAASGEYRRFRPDLPPILTAVRIHDQARVSHPTGVLEEPDQPNAPEADPGTVLADIRELKAKLRRPA